MAKRGRESAKGWERWLEKPERKVNLRVHATVTMSNKKRCEHEGRGEVGSWEHGWMSRWMSWKVGKFQHDRARTMAESYGQRRKRHYESERGKKQWQATDDSEPSSASDGNTLLKTIAEREVRKEKGKRWGCSQIQVKRQIMRQHCKRGGEDCWRADGEQKKRMTRSYRRRKTGRIRAVMDEMKEKRENFTWWFPLEGSSLSVCLPCSL